MGDDAQHDARSPCRGRDAQLLTAQLDLLAGVVAGHSLAPALESLLRVVERVSTDGLLASILLTDQSGKRLLHGAAPSLPADYNAAIDGIEIGPTVGSCGTAAYRRSQVIVEDIEHDPLWADFKDLALKAGLRACWSTPMIGLGGRVLGTFAMYYPEPSRPARSDLSLIDVLVRTVAMAIERSRLDEQRERELAKERALGLTFQRSLLPEIPGHIGPVTLAARYRTGDPGVHVGGDWFDAIEVDDGMMLVVGDVQGHDVEAAALMGQLRTVVRATASEGHPPAAVLARAAGYLELLGSDLLATVLVVRLDVAGQLATNACAGHLPPDAVLLLYTDGLVETRTWDIDEGVHRLGSLLRRCPRTRGPAECWTRRSSFFLPATGVMTSLSSPRRCRRAGARPIESRANAVRQSDRPVRVTLESMENGLLVEVFDSSHRMPSLSDSAPESTDGRGLRLVDSVCETWGIREELDGKTVWARVAS